MLVFNRLWPQLNATDLDGLVLEIAVATCLVIFIVDLVRWFTHLQADNRTWNDCWGDVRAMNTYNSYFIGAIIVFFGLVADPDKGLKTIPITAFIMFLAALVLAACAIFFFPIHKHSGGDAVASAGVRRRWLWALIPTQCTIILGTAGITNVALSLLTKQP